MGTTLQDGYTHVYGRRVPTVAAVDNMYIDSTFLIASSTRFLTPAEASSQQKSL